MSSTFFSNLYWLENLFPRQCLTSNRGHSAPHSTCPEERRGFGLSNKAGQVLKEKEWTHDYFLNLLLITRISTTPTTMPITVHNTIPPSILKLLSLRFYHCRWRSVPGAVGVFRLLGFFAG